MKPEKPKGIALEQSHDRARLVVRVKAVPPLAAPPAPALHEPLPPGSPPTPGRKFAKDNQGRKLRQAKEQAKARAEGIATLNPATAPAWLRPHIEHGAPYVGALVGMLVGKPALHPLAGDCADAHVMYRAMLGLAAQADDPKSSAALMSEARGWLREHRTALATLSALAGALKLPDPPSEVDRIRAELEEKHHAE